MVAPPPQHDDEQDESAKRRIAHIIEALGDPNADLAAILPSFAAPDAAAPAGPKVGDDGVPTHLRDLDEAELPEQQRNLVLGQINIFRAEAAAREAKKKAQEEAMDRRRGPGMGPGQGSGGYNQQQGGTYGRNQGPPPGQTGRQWGAGAQQQHGQGSGHSQDHNMSPMGSGPQSYNRPVGFVRAAPDEMSNDLPDEERERLRQNEKQRRHDAELADVGVVVHLHLQPWLMWCVAFAAGASAGRSRARTHGQAVQGGERATATGRARRGRTAERHGETGRVVR